MSENIYDYRIVWQKWSDPLGEDDLDLIPEEEITITGGGGNAKITIKTLPVQIKIYEDNWYDIQPVQEANQYLASDVPFVDQAVYTLPIHQRSENFTLRVFSDSPFPVSLTSMMWEGTYTPRYYRRT